MRFKILLVFLFCASFGLQVSAKKSKHIICIEDASIALSEKEAIVILPGLGDGKKQRKIQQEFFCGQGFDIYIPDYINEESFDATYNEFSDFHAEHQLGSYKKLHVFAYILGTWTINTYIQKNGKGNIASIVYDRSPMQELAPILIVENIPGIAKFLFGKLPEDLSKMPYPVIDTLGLKIGIMVESKATKILRHYEDKAKEKFTFNWGNIDYKQAYDDLMYTYLNHDEMYTRVDVFGNYALHFFKEGSFGNSARRNWYGWNSFEKLPKIKKSALKKQPALKGIWKSENFTRSSPEDSVYNYISIDNERSFIQKNIPSDQHPIFPRTESFGPGHLVKTDKKSRFIQFYEGGDVFPVQQLPEQNKQGSWSLELDEVRYQKTTPKSD
ncbi:MAG: hypothetical protein Crog4KO_19430 [Crocinitomicaceae bacterium]